MRKATIAAFIAMSMASVSFSTELNGVTEIPTGSSVGFSVDIDSSNSTGVYYIGNAFTTGIADLSRGSTLSGNLYICDVIEADVDGDGSVDSDAGCQVWISLGNTVNDVVRTTGKRFYVIDIDVSESSLSRLTIRGTNSQTRSTSATGGIFAGAPNIVNYWQDWIIYHNDFEKLADYDNTQWNESLIGGTSAASVILTNTESTSMLELFGDSVIGNGIMVGGGRLIYPAGYTMELLSFPPSADKDVMFEANMAILDPTNINAFVGIEEVVGSSTGMLADGSFPSNASNLAGFRFLASDGTGIPRCIAKPYATGTLVDSGPLSVPAFEAALVNGEWAHGFRKVGFRIRNNNIIDCYVDGALVHTFDVSADNDYQQDATLAFQMTSGAASSQILIIDYVTTVQPRNENP